MPIKSSHTDSFITVPPARSENAALDQAMLRAYPIARSLDYGCALDDVLKLHQRVDMGFGWSDVALQLADDNEYRAEKASGRGQTSVETRFLLHAAACCRLAQAGLEHDPLRRLQAYDRQAMYFETAMSDATSTASTEAFAVDLDGVRHRAWLFRAPGLESGGPAVVVWGGADGWCEAFHPSVFSYLERSLSVCLLELPGQGLARLRYGSALRANFTQLVSSVLDALIARGAGQDCLGVVGHSAGGSLALAAAGADDRIKACCSNGGSYQLQNGLIKYPRVLQRFARMLGDAVADTDALDFLNQLDVPNAVTNMRASLLCLQGGQDVLVADDEANRLVELRGDTEATLEYWPTGAHCLYNHSLERNSVMTDWFAAQLIGTRAQHDSPRRSL
ncbi:alpha/beta hydrolase family protein [Paraburkholderia aspalathi]|uniref:alpha/beta hydrolase family protein n=1 Tax=Paraburkholderia aspalathi TaxID=1324617 RepID=UPI003CC01C40